MGPKVVLLRNTCLSKPPIDLAGENQRSMRAGAHL
jgi:hypothetical protein